MKQQLKLNESELHNLIEGAVKQLVMEYLPYEGGKVAAKRLQQGDASAFEKYMDYGLNNGWTNDDMTDFQTGIETGPSVVEDEDFEDLNDGPINNAVDGSLEDEIAFEEGRRAVKVNESQLFNIIKESVKKILTEADPRSWDAVARRYDQSDPQKAAYARQRAAQQWNNQYGYNVGYDSRDLANRRIDNRQSQNMELTDDGKYMINQKFTDVRTPNYGDADSRYFSQQDTNRYDPLTQIGNISRGSSHTFGYDPYNADRKEDISYPNAFLRPDSKTNYQQRLRNKGYIGGRIGLGNGQNVANQMAQGNGVYDKSKGGWQ